MMPDEFDGLGGTYIYDPATGIRTRVRCTVETATPVPVVAPVITPAPAPVPAATTSEIETPAMPAPEKDEV